MQHMVIATILQSIVLLITWCLTLIASMVSIHKLVIVREDCYNEDTATLCIVGIVIAACLAIMSVIFIAVYYTQIIDPVKWICIFDSQCNADKYILYWKIIRGDI